MYGKKLNLRLRGHSEQRLREGRCTISLYERYSFWTNMSMPSSAKQQREINKYYFLVKTLSTDKN